MIIQGKIKINKKLNVYAKTFVQGDSKPAEDDNSNIKNQINH